MSYAVIYVERETQKVDGVVGRGMWFNVADQLAAKMGPRAREGFYFKAVNETDHPRLAEFDSSA